MSRTTATSGPRPSTTPRSCARFVSFVNAPDTPDPVVGFVPERDQIKPDLPLLSIGHPLPSWKEAPSDDPGTR